MALLRIALGWVFFYAGIVKVIDPAWTSAGYLMRAETFTALYAWFASPAILPVVDFLNMWGLTLIGVSLILGAFTRVSAILGASMMLLYYFPVLVFPYPNANAYLIDQHIVYALVLIYLSFSRAGMVYGCDRLLSSTRVPQWIRWMI